jgi:hypothetical protein
MRVESIDSRTTDQEAHDLVNVMLQHLPVADDDVQLAAMAELLAMWLATYETVARRAQLLKLIVEAVRAKLPNCIAELRQISTIAAALEERRRAH